MKLNQFDTVNFSFTVPRYGFGFNPSCWNVYGFHYFILLFLTYYRHPSDITELAWFPRFLLFTQHRRRVGDATTEFIYELWIIYLFFIFYSRSFGLGTVLQSTTVAPISLVILKDFHRWPSDFLRPILRHLILSRLIGGYQAMRTDCPS